MTDSGAEIRTPAPQPFRALLRALLPIVLALLIGAVILAALGRDPVQFYGNVVRRTLFSWGGVQEVLVLMAPLLMLAASLIVCFRAGLWNLGIDGQFLLGGVFVAAYAPFWVQAMPQYGASAREAHAQMRAAYPPAPRTGSWSRPT